MFNLFNEGSDSRSDTLVIRWYQKRINTLVPETYVITMHVIS